MGRPVGLDIDERVLRLVAVDRKGTVKSFSAATAPTADDSSQFKDVADQLAAGLEALTKSMQGSRLKPKDVIVSLPESMTYVRSFSLSEMQRDEEEILEEANNYFPLDMDDCYVSWHKLAPLAEKDAKDDPQVTSGEESLVLAVAERIRVDAYVELLDRLGLRVRGVMPESVAVLNALAGNVQHEGHDSEACSQVVVSLRNRRAVIVVRANNDNLYSMVVSAVGLTGEQFAEQIVRKLRLSQDWTKRNFNHEFDHVRVVGAKNMAEALVSYLHGQIKAPIEYALDTKISSLAIVKNPELATAYGLALSGLEM